MGKDHNSLIFLPSKVLCVVRGLSDLSGTDLHIMKILSLKLLGVNFFNIFNLLVNFQKLQGHSIDK